MCFNEIDNADRVTESGVSIIFALMIVKKETFSSVSYEAACSSDYCPYYPPFSRGRG